MGRKEWREDNLGVPEGLMPVLDNLGRAMFYGGLGSYVIGMAMLVFTFMNGKTGQETQIAGNIALFGPLAFWGGLSCGISACWLFWGEEILSVLILIAGALGVFAPFWVPMVIQGATPPNPEAILGAMANGGYGIGIVGLIALVVDVISRVRMRAIQGMKAESLRFGKGHKEEIDTRNVFLGKCWQLPYCRKFVRERCPIYHTRRTCWKERVGCMCEEQVIKNAMEGKAIPKDMVAAAAYIPKNSRLTPQQKAERCQQCVIYNEHQKHKYKAALPTTFVATVVLYFALREPAGNFIGSAVSRANSLINQATLDSTGKVSITNPSLIGSFGVHDLLVIILFFVGFSYAVRMIEWFFFRLKV